MTSDKLKKELKDVLKDPGNRYCARARAPARSLGD